MSNEVEISENTDGSERAILTSGTHFPPNRENQDDTTKLQASSRASGLFSSRAKFFLPKKTGTHKNEISGSMDSKFERYKAFLSRKRKAEDDQPVVDTTRVGPHQNSSRAVSPPKAFATNFFAKRPKTNTDDSPSKYLLPLYNSPRSPPVVIDLSNEESDSEKVHEGGQANPETITKDDTRGNTGHMIADPRNNKDALQPTVPPKLAWWNHLKNIPSAIITQKRACEEKMRSDDVCENNSNMNDSTQAESGTSSLSNSRDVGRGVGLGQEGDGKNKKYMEETASKTSYYPLFLKQKDAKIAGETGEAIHDREDESHSIEDATKSTCMSTKHVNDPSLTLIGDSTKKGSHVFTIGEEMQEAKASNETENTPTRNHVLMNVEILVRKPEVEEKSEVTTGYRHENDGFAGVNKSPDRTLPSPMVSLNDQSNEYGRTTTGPELDCSERTMAPESVIEDSSTTGQEQSASEGRTLNGTDSVDPTESENSENGNIIANSSDLLVLFPTEQTGEEDGKTDGGDISYEMVFAFSLVFIGFCWSLRLMNLLGLSKAMIAEFVRGVGQLTTLGLPTAYVLKHGKDTPLVTLGYIFTAILLASHEIFSRTRYTYEGQFLHIFSSVAISVLWVGFFASKVLSKNTSSGDPKLLLPIACLLLASCINGVSISLDALTTSIVEENSEISLLRAFGGSKYEPFHRIFSMAFQKGASSVLSSMRAMGAFGILPMLMCGQIFSGASVKQAYLLHIMMVMMGTLCSFSSMVLTAAAALESALNVDEALKQAHFVHNHKRSMFGLLWMFFSSLGSMGGLFESPQQSIANVRSIAYVPLPTMSTRPVFNYTADEAPLVLQFSGILSSCESIGENESDVDWIGGSCEYDFALELHEGEVLLIQGTGSSSPRELFNVLTGQRPEYENLVSLSGFSLSDYDPAQWRKDVLLIPPGNPKLLGSPIQFLRRISGLKLQRMTGIMEQDNLRILIDRVSDELFRWGIPLECLNKTWNDLSEEEGYMVLLATGLASQPKILLLPQDESVSFGFQSSFGRSIQKFAKEGGAALLLSN